jgi:LysM repeat protein
MQLELAIIDRTLARVEQGADMNVPAHVVSEGETLHDVSVRYYGTADHWQAIARRNRLESLDLEAGQQLVIPKVGEEIRTTFGVVTPENFWDWFLEHRRKWWREAKRRQLQKLAGGYFQYGPDMGSMVNLEFGNRGAYSERSTAEPEYPPGEYVIGGHGKY